MGISALLFALGLDYQLVQFGNSTYVNETFDQIAQSLGIDQAALPAYDCDGSRELQIFTDSIKTNPRGDSLKAIDFTSGELIQIKNGNLISVSDDPWVEALNLALTQLNQIDAGKRLIHELEYSPYPITLKKGMNRFLSQEPNGKPGMGLSMATSLMLLNTLYLSPQFPLYQIGIGGMIYWNPFSDIKRIESDGVLRSVDPAVALAHEMYHAFDAIRGLLDIRFISGTAYEYDQVAEYRAVYFEDIIRSYFGSLPAKYYSESNPATATGKPSMLDANGLPRRIPAPCILKQ